MNTRKSNRGGVPIRLSESKLKAIIAESVANILNEIGDTNAGYAAIRNAQQKAYNMGRRYQADTFSSYANNLDRQRFQRGTVRNDDSMAVGSVSNLELNYRNFSGGNVKLYKNEGDGSVWFVGTQGKQHALSELCSEYGFSRMFKVYSPATARSIVQWLESPNHGGGRSNQSIPQKAFDWHFWYMQ